MTSDYLCEAGKLLFGKRWQTEMSEALGISDRTVRKWISGENKIPSGIQAEIETLLSDRITHIHEFMETKKMRTQDEIFKYIEQLIPTELWNKYSHLSFGEMADIDELAAWRDDLISAEKDWFE